MNQARTLVELGELYAANLLTEKKGTFPGKDTFKVQKDKKPTTPEIKKGDGAFITAKSKLTTGPENASGFIKPQLDPKLIKRSGDDAYNIRKDSPEAKEFSVSAEKSEVETIDNSMNKSIFDRLYEEVMNDGESSMTHNDVESADAEALDLPTGEEEGEVTVTLDRETAKKLHDVLMAVLTSDEEQHEDEVEDAEDNEFAPSFEATELKELPSTVDKMTKTGNKNNVVHGTIDSMIDGEEAEPRVNNPVDASGKPFGKTLIGKNVSSDNAHVPAKPVPVDSKVSKNVGKTLFAASKGKFTGSNISAPKERDFRKG